MATNATSKVAHGEKVMYMIMSSMTYLAICIAVIFILSLLLLVLVLVWCWCIRPKTSFSKKTVRYSSLHSDDEDDKKKRPKTGRRLLFSDIMRTPHARTVSHVTKATPPHPRHWTNVPVNPNIDINAGHLLLAYIEDNLRDKGRLDKEWEQLMAYQPEDVTTTEGLLLGNKHKNRYPDLLPYDHSRVVLDSQFNLSGSDYINASFIVDIDPSHPRYIAAQGPMQHTVPDFWQMIWEQGINVIVMLTPLSDMGLSQCFQYWPSNGVVTYHKFEIRLVSEHRHSEDYVVRSFYVLNTEKKSSRTVTQFHYLSWSVAQPPASPTVLLEFWRKVYSAYTVPNVPLLVHCSEGVGRTGTYILIDMTLGRLTSGAKEINLAAAVEHLRDQRLHMVKSKSQFEFALDALVEETQMMLNAAALQSKSPR